MFVRFGKFNSDRLALITLAVILGLSAFIRLYGISQYSFTPDDGWEVSIASGSFFDSFYYNFYYFTHPPLGTLFGWLIAAVSINETALRMIPFLPGMALIILSFYLGKKIAGNIMGLVMALIFGFSYSSVVLSQDIRAYNLLLSLLLAMLLSIISYTKNKKTKYLYLYFLFAFLSGFTTYIAALYIAAISLIGLVYLWQEKRINIKKIMVWLAINGLIIIAMVIYFKLQNPSRFMPRPMAYDAASYPQNISIFSARAMEILGYLFLGVKNQFVSAIALALTILGIAALWRDRQVKILSLMALVFIFHLILVFLKVYPFADNRYSYFLLPLLGLSSAYAISHIFRSIRPAYIYSGVAIISLGLTFMIAENNFLRFSFQEFPDTKKERGEMLDALKKTAQGPVIIDNYNAFVFLAKEGIASQKDQGENIFSVESGGIEYFYPFIPKASTLYFERPSELKDFIARYDALRMAEGKQLQQEICYLNSNPLWPMPMTGMVLGNNANSLKNFADKLYQSRAGFFFCTTRDKLSNYFMSQGL